MQNIENGLYIVSTPIGNLEDISFRAKNILQKVDFIICENPKHSLKLLNKLGIKKKLYSLHDYNEEIVIKKLEKFQKSSAIALISDAGAPLISDPGYKLIQSYINKKIFITSVPGPSSLVSAIQLSGLPINNFIFFGFLPKKNNLVKDSIEKLKNTTLTSIFYISGNRLLGFLKEISIELNDRNIAICKELTKKNEYIFRGTAAELIKQINLDKKNLKGEFTLLLNGNRNATKLKIDLQVEKQIKKILEKFSLTETVEIVHKITNISKKEIYTMALVLKND